MKRGSESRNVAGRGARRVEVNENVVAPLTAALIKETIGSTMEVTTVAPGSAPHSEGGKIQRVRDLR
jgi:phenylacetate-coenzyme A ligase PaaK-like adenylate-forming protein